MSGGIKAWAEDDRPREKLSRKGPQVLSDAELLGILIGSGNRKENAVDLGRKILQASENELHRLGKLSVADFKRFRGIGDAKAISLVAALELGRRRKLEHPPSRQRFVITEDFVAEMHPILSDLDHEEFWVMYLNHGGVLLEKSQIGIGGISSTYADQRIIYRKALELKATGIVLFHNHPSGRKWPSPQDHECTSKYIHGQEILNIRLIDHIIIADNDYYSFSMHGHIPLPGSS